MPARTASLRALLGWALVAVVVLAACGTEGAAVPDGTAGAEVASGDGAAAFTANCAMCHGPVGGALVGAVPDRARRSSTSSTSRATTATTRSAAPSRRV
jgi:mono/diheme cytochrome c family protein